LTTSASGRRRAAAASLAGWLLASGRVDDDDDDSMCIDVVLHTLDRQADTAATSCYCLLLQPTTLTFASLFECTPARSLHDRLVDGIMRLLLVYKARDTLNPHAAASASSTLI